MFREPARVIRDEDPEEDPCLTPESSPEGPAPEIRTPEAPPAPQQVAGKCPYLAGRQRLGTYHTAPSRENRCYARATPEKPHAHVSRDRQELLCLCPAEFHERCRDYQSARQHGIPPPSFGGNLPHDQRPSAETPIGLRHKRVRHRRRRPPVALWWNRNRRALLISVVFLISTALFLMMSTYILPVLLGAGGAP